MITKVAGGNAKDIDVAVKAARETLKKSWGLKVPGYERGRLLNKLADLLEERIDEFAALESLDAGMSRARLQPKCAAHTSNAQASHSEAPRLWRLALRSKPFVITPVGLIKTMEKPLKYVY